MEDNGGTVTKDTLDSDSSPFPEIAGFVVHGINGEMVVPLLALVLLVLSFRAVRAPTRRRAGAPAGSAARRRPRWTPRTPPS